MTDRISIPFATSGDTTAVPIDSGTESLDFTQGWSDAYQRPLTEAGALSIDRRQHNKLWNAVTGNIKQWQEQNAPQWFDDIAYEAGAEFRYLVDGKHYICENNAPAGTLPTNTDYFIKKPVNKTFSNIAIAKTKSFDLDTRIDTKGYFSIDDGGEGEYIVVSSGSITPDELTNHTLPNGNILKLIPRNGEYNAKQCGIKGDGSDEAAAIYAFEATLKATVMNAFFPSGTYDVGVMNWPFRQSGFTPLKDYGGITVRGAGKGKTVFRTTSSVGADVLQLNAIKGITFKDLSTTAILTAFDDAGSNGVSITNGGEDIHIDIDHFDLPGVDKGAYLDGGKAFTIQNGGATVHGYSNITMKGDAKDCPYLFEASVTFDTFSTFAGKNIKSVKVDISGEDCWRGVSLASSEPAGIVDSANLGSGITINAHLINCAQPHTIDRWCGGSVKTTTINTKNKSALYKPFAADQKVIGQLIKNGLYCESTACGMMKEVDSKLVIGGGAMGAYGLLTYSYKCQIENTLSTPFVNNDEIDVIDFSGNTTAFCDIKIARVLDATGGALIEQTNSVSYNQALSTPSIFVGSSAAGETFSANSQTSEIKMKRATGPLGTQSGFVYIVDSVSGITYQVPMYSVP